MSLRLSILTVALALLTGCAAAGKSDEKLLEETLESYAAIIRWGNFEQALSFVDPETLKAHPLSELDLQRYHQFQVTLYNDQPARHVAPDQVRQLVEIGIVNVNTQAARSVIDTQVWRYDAKGRRWWLMSGLPDITAH